LGQDASETCIRIKTNRKWFGDPRFGTFTLYLDGRRSTILRPRSEVNVVCGMGRHTIRARQWWYFSRTVEFEVSPNVDVEFEVDILRESNVLQRFLITTFMPWRALSLFETTTSPF
jgi:hypothetical protein